MSEKKIIVSKASPRKQETMPVLALRGLVLFPHMVLHFDVGRAKSVLALNEAMSNERKIFLVAQRDIRPFLRENSC